VLTRKLSSTVILILLIVASIFSFSLVRDYLLGYRMQKALEEAIENSITPEKDILSFIRKNFIDSRGLIGSEVRNDKLMEYSLLESMGQLMEYALIKKNGRLFDITWRITKRYFLSPRGYLYWRINRRTLSQDDSTSLLDSLRVAYSLIRAYETFTDERYLKDGIHIAENIIRFNTYNNYLVDYFDGRTENSSRSISLFYLNLKMLSKISQYIPGFKALYGGSKKILEGAIKISSGFFPTEYNISSDRYYIPSKVNMIEQAYIAMNIGDYNSIKPFVSFIDREMEERGKICNSYYWSGKEATVDESPGVYMSLSLLFLNLGVRERADMFFSKIQRFKSEDYGFGDYKNRDFYVFDQLKALILLASIKEYDIIE
jgi:hypothetical protein